jgi:hypothetical protein
MVDFHEIWYGGNSIEGDLDSTSFNLISSTILKWLRFSGVTWRHEFQPRTAKGWDFLTVGLLWLHHIQSLANVTMAAIVIGKVGNLVLPRTSFYTSRRDEKGHVTPRTRNKGVSIVWGCFYIQVKRKLEQTVLRDRDERCGWS